jgi:transcriptional adapter 3
MAPTNVSSKGKAKPGSKPSATPRSRNTTPLPNVRASTEPSSSSSSYFNKPLSSYLKRCEVTLEEILDTGGSSTSIPSGSKLLAMREKIESTVLKNVETRCTHSESVLRELQHMRKNRAPRDREKDKDADDRERKQKLKKVAKKHDEDGKHPPTTGAHGVTRQDGVDAHKGTCITVEGALITTTSVPSGVNVYLFTISIVASSTWQQHLITTKSWT